MTNPFIKRPRPNQPTWKQIRTGLCVKEGCNSYGQLMEAMNLSKTAVRSHLKILQSKRLVTWDHDKTGTIRLTSQGEAYFENFALTVVDDQVTIVQKIREGGENG